MKRRELLKVAGGALIGVSAGLVAASKVEAAPSLPTPVSSGITNPSLVLKSPDSSSASAYAVLSWTDSLGKVHTVNIDMNSDGSWPIAAALAVSKGNIL